MEPETTPSSYDTTVDPMRGIIWRSLLVLILLLLLLYIGMMWPA